MYAPDQKKNLTEARNGAEPFPAAALCKSKVRKMPARGRASLQKPKPRTPMENGPDCIRPGAYMYVGEQGVPTDYCTYVRSELCM